MNRRILLLFFVVLALAVLSACGNGIDKLPGVSSGALTVQITQPPPASLLAGTTAGLVANVVNDTKSGQVTWSCTPVGACGTFNPTTTGYQIGTLYTAPMNVNGPVTPNLGHSVTIIATSVTDSSKSASASVAVAQQYAFVEEGYGSWGIVGSVMLDGAGNVLAGEVDFSCSNSNAYCGGGGGGHFQVCPSSGTLSGNTCGTPASSYTLDATGHGKLTLQIYNCCVQTNSITFTSNSHAITAEDDQFSGLTFGGVGSMDMQTAGPSFSTSQLSGGYSFTLTGYSSVEGDFASWGGIFTANGAGNLTGGTFDENFGGGAGYGSVLFSGTYSAPDANGRGIITLSSSPDTPGPCGAAQQPGCTQYVYYMVSPQVIRLTALTNTANAANTGSAFGQGSLATAANDANAALTGNFIFSEFGFTSNANGGEQGSAAGQFTTDGHGNITGGVMDLNAFGAPATIPVTGLYSISGSPRGTVTGPAGQTYNVYLTDPNLNLLDPNNPSGTGGALLLETDAVDTIGVVIPQTDPSAAPSGNYVILLSDQANPPDADGGFTGDFATSSTNMGTLAGEGDFQGAGNDSSVPVVGPLSGTFTADGANPGRFTGAIVTAPAFPTDVPGLITDAPGTENVSYYMANGSQGFIIETDSIAPVFGAIEAQGTIQSAQKRQRASQQSRSSKASKQPVNRTSKQSEISRRSR